VAVQCSGGLKEHMAAAARAALDSTEQQVQLAAVSGAHTLEGCSKQQQQQQQQEGPFYSNTSHRAAGSAACRTAEG
jgi:hypothetical protein